MEALIKLCGCTSKSSLDAYEILLSLFFFFFFCFFFVCCGYYVVYTINGRNCRLLCKSERRRGERERDVILFFYQRLLKLKQRERECEMLFLFYQSKDVTDTSLIVCTLPGKLHFSKLWSCEISILKLCAHFKLLSPLC